ncbi:hypothetical protein ACJX0J_019862, partial [Zea mays]
MGMFISENRWLLAPYVPKIIFLRMQQIAGRRMQQIAGILDTAQKDMRIFQTF